MSKYWTYVLTPVVGFLLVAGAPGEAGAQLDHLPYQLKYDRGQTVQPVFEGWSRNADGTFNMHFGYLNRNYQEEPHVPVGPDNRIEPGNPDQGQPTYFQVRANREVFTVAVPADFGDQQLIWSLTTQGQTLRAIGWLDPLWELTGVPEEGAPVVDEGPNDPPRLTLRGTSLTATVGTPLTVTATVSDDGNPKPREARRPIVGSQDQPPLLTPPADALPIPVNLPQHTNLAPPNPPRGKATVSYRVWRGPADIRTEPALAEAVGGNATTAITFTQPGEYQLQVSAHDGALTTSEMVTVVVR